MWPFSRRGRDTPKAKSDDSASALRGILAPFWQGRGDRSLQGSEAIFSAVTRLANTLAATPFHLYRENEIARDHPLEMLLSRQPSPGMTPHLYFQQLESCRDTNGNAYALKVYDPDGTVCALDVLDPSSVTPMRDAASGDIWYVLRPPDGQTFYIHGREMLHMRHVSAGGLVGVSPIDVLRDTLDYDKVMKSFSVEQVRGINSCVVLEFPAANMGKEQKANIIKDFREHYTASGGALLVVSGGAKANVINKSPVDGRVLDVERVTKNKVAGVYNIPPHMMGDYSDTSYTSQEQEMLEFICMTMLSIYKQYEDEHNLKLLTAQEIKEGFYWRFERDALLLADTESRTAFNQAAIRSGQRTVNEVRVRDGYPPLPDGDVLMCSKDLAPMRWVTRQTTANERQGTV